MTGAPPEAPGARSARPGDTAGLAAAAVLVYLLCLVSPLLGPSARSSPQFWSRNVPGYAAVWIPAAAVSGWCVLRTRANSPRLFRLSLLLLGAVMILPLLLLGDAA